MITSVDQWLAFLNRADTLAGLPLVVGGIMLMVFGWRLWKICVVLSFGLIGAGLGARFAPSTDFAWLYALVVAALLGAASYWPARHSVVILGGLIGAGLVTHVASGAGLTGSALWLVTGVGFIGALALALINRGIVVIGVTAILGAALLMSGLTVLCKLSPSFYGHVAATATGSSIVLPFLLLVPSVVSCCYQIGESGRHGGEL